MDISPYINELILWNKTHNLVSKNEINNLEEHIADSLSLISFIEKSKLTTIIDIGSGGGFPVIPIAFWTKTQNQKYLLIATDIIDKKLSFLRWCSAKFDLNLEVIKVDKNFMYRDSCLIISRAFSSVKNIVEWQKKHAPNAEEFLLLKGNKAQEELSEANIQNYELIKNPRGYIIKIMKKDIEMLS